MKVLILHQHFNTPESGGPLRSYYLAKALLDNGLEVVVITAKGNTRRATAHYEGIEIHYLPIAYENRFGFYKRGISFMRFAIDATKVARTIPGISVCYAISVPLTVGQSAIWIERTMGIPFLFEVGDLWPEAPVQLGFIKNPFLKESLFWLERRIYSRAKTVVALSEPIRESIAKKMRSGKKIMVIPNMADTDFLGKEEKDPILEKKYSVTGRFVVSYIGAVGFANGLDYFLECARASQISQLPISFVLCGDGGLVRHFQEAKKTLGLGNLQMLPFQNRTGVREILNLSDASFICYRPFPVLETGSPHKYFDGLASGKLIIVNFKGWIREEIEREKCGIALDSRHPHEFVPAIKPFLDDRALLEKYQNNARRLAEVKYSRKELSRKFVGLFQ